VFDWIYYFFLVTYIAATFLQLCYWLLLFTKVAKVPTNNPVIEAEQGAISVVICAKNEEKNLRLNLARILNQTYRCFEILLINDNSSDNSDVVLLEYQKKYSYLRIKNNSYIKKSVGKKAALSFGIDHSQYEIIAVTDADCRPATSSWLSKMQAQLQEDKDIVLGYAPYEATKHWLNRFIRFETWIAAIQYFSYALAKIPYMGVGRNMLYRKKLYVQANGFRSHEHIASGDDDLFIREVATSNNVAISLDPDTFVYSDAQPNLHTFLRQKMRHLSTGKYYRWHHQVLLGLFGASQAWHYFAFILLILSKKMLILTISLYLLRIFTVGIISARLLSIFREQFIFTSIVWLDAALALYYALAAPLPYIAKTMTWK
jgi:poly-beta-1,6-N-acetyl-D-glucosamine synthase